MKKQIVTAIAIGITGTFPALAQEDNNSQNPEDPKTELKAEVRTQEVKETLDQPDGAAFKLTNDGGWQLFGTGTGSYDFNDPDDIMDATKEAMLKAKSNISKYLSEKIDSEETLNNLTEKKKKMSKGSDGSSASVSKESIKTQVESIKNSSDAILSGVITLSTDKKPSGEDSGTVNVKVGVSSKSLAVAGKIAGDISKNLKNRNGNSGSGGSPSFSGSNGPKQQNVREVKQSASDF